MSAAVVKLPTAAPRKVQNCRHVPSRWAARVLRQEQSVDFGFKSPERRAADEIAKALHPMTPERWLLLGMLHTMPAEAFEKMTAFGVHGHATVRALMMLAKGGVGLNLDVMNALERLGQ